jgi:hypothetical protein
MNERLILCVERCGRCIARAMLATIRIGEASWLFCVLKVAWQLH